MDSKAEKLDGQRTATLQTSQFSMTVRQVQSGQTIDVEGSLPKVLIIGDSGYITTTIFIKYNYTEMEGSSNELNSVTIAAVPNGLLQERYNPSPYDTIWLAGRDAPTRGEAFRVRLSFERLKAKANWRVQNIPLSPKDFVWSH